MAKALTVREWFRLQRKALWEADRPTYCTGRFAVDLHTLTEKVIKGLPIDPVESLGDTRLIFSKAEEWDRSRRLVDRIHQQLRYALNEMDRERQRRVMFERMREELLS